MHYVHSQEKVANTFFTLFLYPYDVAFCVV